MSGLRFQSYGAEDLTRFLAAVDRQLTRRVRMELIGGSAASLGHGVRSTTIDVDTFTVVGRDLRAAAARAREETELDIPVSQATVADVPYNYEDRLVRLFPTFVNLEVWVLEKHDLALSKAIRCDERDVQQIREMHAGVGLSSELLTMRFMTEMTHVVGEPARTRSNFLLLIDAVFGELQRVTADRRLRAGRR